MVTERVLIVVDSKGARSTARGIRSIGTTSRTAASAVRLLTTALAAVGVALSARALVQAADEFTRLSNSIRVATRDTGDFQGVFDQLRLISNQTRSSLSDNASLFQRLSVATANLGTSNAEVLEVVAGLNAALRVSGTSASEATAGLTQLSQGLASGRFQGDELRSVLESLPLLAQRLAGELGVTTGELRALGEAGELNTERVFPALQRALRGFSAELSGIEFTVSDTANVLRNEFVAAVGEINNELGGTSGLNDVILTLSENIREILLTTVGGTIQAFGLLAEAGLRLRDAFQAASIFTGDLLGAFAETQLQAARLRRSFISLDVLGLVFDTEDFAAVTNEIKLLETQTADWAEEQRNVRIEAEESSKRYQELVDQVQDVGKSLRDAAGEARSLEEASTETRVTAGAAGPGDVAGLLAGATQGAAAGGIIPGPTLEQTENALAASISSALSDGFADSLQRGNGLQAFSDAFRDAANQSLVDGFESGFGALQEGLSGVFDSVASAVPDSFSGAFGELGGALGDALSGALQFVALQGLSALFGGGGNSARSSGGARSAVTSTQAVRGVVAGPNSIAVAQVGDDLASAVAPLLEESVVQTLILRRIESLLGGNARGPSVASSASSQLALTAPVT